MRIAALIVVLVLFVELANPKPLQSPKGAELFPLPRVVQLPPAQMTIVSSNAINSVQLVWNPNPGTNIAGYYVYWGTASRSYSSKLNTTTTNRITHQPIVHTNWTVNSLIQGVRYYYTATAYDTDGLESDYSNEADYTLPYTYNTITLNWTPAAANTLMASTDLITWRVLTNSYPPVTFLRTKPVEFYRLRQ